MYDLSIAAHLKNLATKKYSATELTQTYLNRIKHYDSSLNSFITVTEDIALEQAAKADLALSKGEKLPLLGIPIAQKDIFVTEGVKTTCGSKMLDNFIGPYDATVITQFKNAGAILLGKTNMDEFAMGSSNENSYYGPVKNPWNLECVPGGSSGGAAAALAARLAPGATGTDTGGSVRQPAAFCGVSGLKPTYGRVSRYGMIAFASSLDQGGPMATSAEDLAILLNVMAGYDPKDSTSVQKEVPDYTLTLENSLKNIKIGLPKEFFTQELDPDIATLIHTAAKEYERLGATLVEVSLPTVPLAVPAYYVIAPSECSSNLARYDGVRYGYRCQDPKDLLDLYERSRGEAFGEEVKRRIIVGTYALSSGYYEAYYRKAQQIRRLIHEDFQKAFKEVDILLGATTPTTAFKLGEKSDPVSMYLADIYTPPVNLAGLPSLSIPVGFSDGKPVGMQLIGNFFTEGLLLNAAHQYQQNTDWHTQFPKAYKGY